MNIQKEIETYLNSKIDSNKKLIIKEIAKITGINSKKHIDLLTPVYIANEEHLKMTLEIEDLNECDRNFIEYLLCQFGETEKLYIGHYGKLRKENVIGLLSSSSKFIVCLDSNKEIHAFLYEQNIYQGTYSIDVNYILNLLLFFGLIRIENKFYPPVLMVSLDLNIPNAQSLIYIEILTNLAIMIVYKIHTQNIYVFDNKTLISSNEQLKSNISEYFYKFYNLFKDIIDILLLDYKEFVNIVGKTNFESFTEMVLTDNTEYIDEVLENMHSHKLSYMNNCATNTKISEKSRLKLKKKDQ